MKAGAIDGACEFIEQMVSNLDHLDMTLELAETLDVKSTPRLLDRDEHCDQRISDDDAPLTSNRARGSRCIQYVRGRGSWLGLAK